jgi:hypothetical protein
MSHLSEDHTHVRQHLPKIGYASILGFVNCQIIASASISRKKTSFAVIILANI